MQLQLHWTCHVVRIKDHRLPKKLLNGKLSEGKRYQGGQKKRFKHTLKVSMKSFGLNPSSLYLVQDRGNWQVVKRGAKTCEARRSAGILEKALSHQPLLPPFLVLIVITKNTKLYKISSGTKLLFTFLSLKVFRHEARETQSFYADCFYIVSSQANQHAAPVAHKVVWPRPALKVNLLLPRQELN